MLGPPTQKARPVFVQFCTNKWAKRKPSSNRHMFVRFSPTKLSAGSVNQRRKPDMLVWPNFPGWIDFHSLGPISGPDSAQRTSASSTNCAQDNPLGKNQNVARERFVLRVVEPQWLKMSAPPRGGLHNVHADGRLQKQVIYALERTPAKLRTMQAHRLWNAYVERTVQVQI